MHSIVNSVYNFGFILQESVTPLTGIYLAGAANRSEKKLLVSVGVIIEGNQMKTYGIVKIVICVLLLVFITCQPRMQYIGTCYPPTANVHIFFNTQDIPCEYTIIGKIVGIQQIELFSTDFQPKLIKKARNSGADAVLVNHFGYNNSLSVSEADSGSANTMHVNVSNDLILDAFFLKYNTKHP
jgi:hypothetical protein